MVVKQPCLNNQNYLVGISIDNPTPNLYHLITVSQNIFVDRNVVGIG
jgi:hypothetical protein